MRINTNIVALNAYDNLESTSNDLDSSLATLSSGYHINKAADDAGPVVSESLKSQVSGLMQATRNAQDGISVAQSAEGALSSVQAMLERMCDLVIQSTNTDASDSTARQAAQNEIVQLRNEIDRMANTTSFDNARLLDGSFGAPESRVAFTTLSGIDVTNTANFASAQQLVEGALSEVSRDRGQLGFLQNRLQSTLADLQVSGQNLTASESPTADADMSLEMVNFTKNLILLQAGTAALAKAEAVPQTILKLLQ